MRLSLVLVAVLGAARLVVPRVLGAVASTRQRDLFVLTVFLVLAPVAAEAALMMGYGVPPGHMVRVAIESSRSRIPTRARLTTVAPTCTTW